MGKNIALKKQKSIIVFSILVLVVVLFTVSKYIPTEDGGLHLSTAVSYSEIKKETTKFNEYLEINQELEPNVLSDYFLSILIDTFPIEIAEKILLLLAILIFISGYLLYYSYHHDGISWFVILIVPFAFSYPYHLGFYNYNLGMGFFWFAILFYHKINSKSKWWNNVPFVLSVVLIFVSHIVPAILLLFYIVVDSLLCIFSLLSNRDFSKNEFISLKKILYSRVIVYLVMILLVIFILSYMNTQSGAGLHIFGNFKNKIYNLLTLSSIFSFHLVEFIIAVIYSSTLIISSITIIFIEWKKNNSIFSFKNNKLLILSLSFAFLYLAAPNSMSGGTMLSCRLLLIPFLIVLPWISNHIVKYKLAYKLLSITFITGTLIFAASIVIAYKIYSNEIKQLVSVTKYISPNKTVLFVSNSNFGYDNKGKQLSQRVAPFMNAEGYIVAHSKTIGLSNLMAWTGYALVNFKEDYSPIKWLYNKDACYFGDSKNIFEYNSKKTRRIDYIIYRKDKVIIDNEGEGNFLRKNLYRFSEKDWNLSFEPVKNLYQLDYISKDSKIMVYRNIYINQF